jgi:hypothetical protein
LKRYKSAKEFMDQIVQQKSINIADTVITTDLAGRFCLNDLHKAAMASGRATDSHRPGNFLKSPGVEAFAQILSDATNIASVETIRGGPRQGSYGVELIVLRYAAWIDPEFEVQVYKSFHSVAVGQAPVAVPKPSAISPAKEFRAIFGIARLIGLDKNAAAISANQGTAALTGVNMLQLMDRTHLATPSQEIYYTPTELGSRFVKSAKAFNQLLVEAGLQGSIAGHWVPTEKGRKHAYVMDTGKAHSSGAPIQQVKWRDSVLAEVAL